MEDRMTNETLRDQLDATLHRFHVHDGFPDHRRKLAVALEVNGIEPDDVCLLAESIAAQRKKTSDSVPAILAKILGDTKSAKFRIEDIKRGVNLRKSKQVDHYPGKSLWKDPNQEPLDLHRLRRMAYAIIFADRKPASVAASVLQCTEDEALTYAEQHRQERLGDSALLRPSLNKTPPVPRKPPPRPR